MFNFRRKQQDEFEPQETAGQKAEYEGQSEPIAASEQAAGYGEPIVKNPSSATSSIDYQYGLTADAGFGDFGSFGDDFGGFGEKAAVKAEPIVSEIKMDEERIAPSEERMEVPMYQAPLSEPQYEKEEILSPIEPQETEVEEEKVEPIHVEGKQEEVPTAFNPDDYAINLMFGETHFFEADPKEMDSDTKDALIFELLSSMKMAVININNLVNLVLRKNKKLYQFEEITKAFEFQKTDFENYKKRNRDLESKAKEEGFAKALTAMLPTLDNFDRALPMISDSSIRAGIELISKQFAKALVTLGVVEMECLGKEFDPNFHNAILTGVAESKEQEDKIIEVLQKGYACGDKVLRYAQVRVAK